MRQIKFRAWSPRKQKFIDYDYQLGIEYDETDYENCIFQQFTGLTDINNKEIYEGDILDFRPYDYDQTIVEYDSVVWKDGCYWVHGERLYEFSNSSIVGNIFEGNNK
jgi:hypothetical protein